MERSRWSSACSETWLWVNRVAFAGSIPEAIQSMIMSSMLSRMMPVLSYSVVKACQSAAKKKQSFSSWSFFQFASTPM